jgi:mannose/cellobiose epimerase-like protein (N-acyl-D-glucosamine 2-epimerase family)
MQKALLRTAFVGIFFHLLFQYSILQAQSIIQGEFWKRQAIEDVIKPWNEHAIDKNYGAYYSYLERDWQPFNGHSKFPGMISRHLFSYSVAYLLSGEASYREQARKTFDYLIMHGWDKKYGGWYTELDRKGAVVDASKDMFMQTYAITGLAMYYLITKDAQVKEYIDRSISLLEEHAWDTAGNGGYVSALNQDLSVKAADKAFSPQLAPLSGYLLYLYAATRDASYLQMSERILQTVLDRMTDQASGWIMERYDREWQPDSARNEWMNTGHNIEVAWMLMRLYDLTGKKTYLTRAQQLNEQLLYYAFQPKTGIWYHQVRVNDPSQHSEDSPWWVQAYGNMFQLYMYHHSGNLKHLQHFREGGRFWNEHMMDSTYGGAFLSVKEDGSAINAKKAVRTKTSYHSMEHGLLNYLYLDMWVNHSSVRLHYFIDQPDNRRLYPLPIEEKAYQIEEVLINGEPWGQINYREGYIMLPEEKGLSITVSLSKR